MGNEISIREDAKLKFSLLGITKTLWGSKIWQNYPRSKWAYLEKRRELFNGGWSRSQGRSKKQSQDKRSGEWERVGVSNECLVWKKWEIDWLRRKGICSKWHWSNGSLKCLHFRPWLFFFPLIFLSLPCEIKTSPMLVINGENLNFL